jgi:hypothetical protein
MNLIDQLEQKKLDRQHFIDCQSRLHSNLVKSLNLIDETTQIQIGVYDQAISALETTIGIPPSDRSQSPQDQQEDA